MISQTQLDQLKIDLSIRSGYGISLPVAGFLYWSIMGAAGFVLDVRTWNLVACFSSGLIYPLGLILSKPLKSTLHIDGNPLTSLGGLAVLTINLLWPLHIAVFFSAPDLLVLSLAIGMGLHWPVIGWMYKSKTCLAHSLIRILGVTCIWFIVPEFGRSLIPFFVAVTYGISIAFMKLELKRKRTFKQG